MPVNYQTLIDHLNLELSKREPDSKSGDLLFKHPEATIGNLLKATDYDVFKNLSLSIEEKKEILPAMIKKLSPEQYNEQKQKVVYLELIKKADDGDYIVIERPITFLLEYIHEQVRLKWEKGFKIFKDLFVVVFSKLMECEYAFYNGSTNDVEQKKAWETFFEAQQEGLIELNKQTENRWGAYLAVLNEKIQELLNQITQTLETAKKYTYDNCLSFLKEQEFNLKDIARRLDPACIEEHITLDEAKKAFFRKQSKNFDKLKKARETLIKIMEAKEAAPSAAKHYQSQGIYTDADFINHLNEQRIILSNLSSLAQEIKESPQTPVAEKASLINVAEHMEQAKRGVFLSAMIFYLRTYTQIQQGNPEKKHLSQPLTGAIDLTIDLIKSVNQHPGAFPNKKDDILALLKPFHIQYAEKIRNFLEKNIKFNEEWEKSKNDYVTNLLKNPTYAGMFIYLGENFAVKDLPQELLKIRLTDKLAAPENVYSIRETELISYILLALLEKNEFLIIESLLREIKIIKHDFAKFLHSDRPNKIVIDFADRLAFEITRNANEELRATQKFKELISIVNSLPKPPEKNKPKGSNSYDPNARPQSPIRKLGSLLGIKKLPGIATTSISDTETATVTATKTKPDPVPATQETPPTPNQKTRPPSIEYTQPPVSPKIGDIFREIEKRGLAKRSSTPTPIRVEPTNSLTASTRSHPGKGNTKVPKVSEGTPVTTVTTRYETPEKQRPISPLKKQIDLFEAKAAPVKNPNKATAKPGQSLNQNPTLLKELEENSIGEIPPDLIAMLNSTQLTSTATPASTHTSKQPVETFSATHPIDGEETTGSEGKDTPLTRKEKFPTGVLSDGGDSETEKKPPKGLPTESLIKINYAASKTAKKEPIIKDPIIKEIIQESIEQMASAIDKICEEITNEEIPVMAGAIDKMYEKISNEEIPALAQQTMEQILEKIKQKATIIKEEQKESLIRDVEQAITAIAKEVLVKKQMSIQQKPKNFIMT